MWNLSSHSRADRILTISHISISTVRLFPYHIGLAKKSGKLYFFLHYRKLRLAIQLGASALMCQVKTA